MDVAHTLRSYWGGERPLWPIFWLWGVVGSWLIAAILGGLAYLTGGDWTFFVISAAVMIPYTVWILVSVWRCAENAAESHWATIARFLTIAWALNVFLVGAFIGLDLLALSV